MRILYFSTYFYPYVSGITTSPFLALSHLSRKHEVTAFTFPHEKHLPRLEYLNKIKTVRLPYLIRLSKGFISPGLFWYFYRRVKRYDCVLLNSPNFEGIGLALAARLQGVPVITLFNCKVDITGSISGWFLKTGLNLSVYAQLLLSSRIVTYTKDYFESFPSLRPFVSRTDFVLPCIPHRTPDEAYGRILAKQKKGHRWIGFVGRIAREKGIEYLIEAMKKLRKTVPGAMLLLAGPGGNDVVGEKSYGDYVKDLLESAHVPYRMLGKLSDRELAALYEKLDVLVLPSVNHTEAFGIVQAEAMMAGTPVVASNIPGVRIPVSVTGMGMTVNPKDANGLKRTLAAVLSNRRAYTSLALKKHAQALFDIHKAYAGYDRIFKR